MLDPRQRNAISKAVELGLPARVRRIRFGLYRVPSTSEAGVTHTVTVDGRGTYRCSCVAGQFNRPCAHAAAVYVAKVEHMAKVRVTGPAPDAPPAPTPPAPIPFPAAAAPAHPTSRAA